MDGLTRLALAARNGDRAALEAVVQSSYDPVWRLCAGLVDRQSADDLAQEAFSRVVRALPGFAGRSSARTWLLSIARKTCMDELRARDRARRRRRALEGRPGEPIVAGEVGEGAVVGDLVGRLEPDRRAAFVLTQLLGLRYEDAAEVCECPVGTIRSRVARAREDLVELLSSDEAPPRRRSAQP